MRQFLSALMVIVSAQAASANCTASFTAVNVPTIVDPYNVLFSNLSTTSAPSGTNLVQQLSYDFGDGSTATNAPGYLNHSYGMAGTYTATLYLNTYDSATNTLYCSDTVSQTIVLPHTCLDHDSHYSIQWTGSGTQYTFTNSSLDFAGEVKSSVWSFGDGSTSTQLNATHTYASTGTYTVQLITTWTDTVAGGTACVDTYSHALGVGGNSYIQGYVYTDSSTGLTQDTLKVWLIGYDSLSNTLSAVDSQVVAGFWGTLYQFNNVPAGTYYTKAQKLNQAAGTAGYIPTYHVSSVYWNTATAILHDGVNISAPKFIYLEHGTVTNGPGFIGGNVSLGANKGTGNGVEGLIIYLRDPNNHLIKSVYTNANGDFSFSNIPLGTYSLYPESMNYTTTPITNVTITSAQPSATGFRFGQTTNEIKPKATGVENVTKATYLLYPNPANDKVIVRWANVNGTANIVITNIAGQKVFQSENVKMSGNTEINVSTLQSGLYFIKVESNGTQEITKLAIQH